LALRPTIHRASLDISDLDRAYYSTHPLVLARHPSETDERMMVRVLAFAMFADESLSFGGGISESDEPDLWAKDLTGHIRLWIEVGQPDPRVVRKASHRAEQVVVMAYGRGVDPWWNKTRSELNGLGNVRVLLLSATDSSAVAALAARNMTLHVLIQEGVVSITDATTSIDVTPATLSGQ